MIDKQTLFSEASSFYIPPMLGLLRHIMLYVHGSNNLIIIDAKLSDKSWHHIVDL